MKVVPPPFCFLFCVFGLRYLLTSNTLFLAEYAWFCRGRCDYRFVWTRLFTFQPNLTTHTPTYEAAFASAHFLLTGPLPVGLNDHVCVLLATTPGKLDSWFMRSIRLISEETGKPIIPVLRTYQPCDAHMKTDAPWMCQCKVNKRATWKNPIKERIWKPLWGTESAVFAAENLGIELDANDSMFHADWVHALRTRPRKRIDSMARYVYIGIDPAEGGFDQFAITAMTLVDTVWVVSTL